jgi:hypothetical protein
MVGSTRPPATLEGPPPITESVAGGGKDTSSKWLTKRSRPSWSAGLAQAIKTAVKAEPDQQTIQKVLAQAVRLLEECDKL